MVLSLFRSGGAIHRSKPTTISIWYSRKTVRLTWPGSLLLFYILVEIGYNYLYESAFAAGYSGRQKPIGGMYLWEVTVQMRP